MYKNEICLIYIANKEMTRTKIFGYNFVQRNKNKCKIIYHNHSFELAEYFNEELNVKESPYIKIKLRLIVQIFDFSYMFDNCISLISVYIPYKNELNLTYINDKSFYDSKYNTFEDDDDENKIVFFKYSKEIEIKSIECIFSNCSSLKSLPDISIWNINKVKSLYRMFFGCNSLISLPDLSKWNTIYVYSMNNMFYECFSSIIIPSKLNS